MAIIAKEFAQERIMHLAGTIKADLLDIVSNPERTMIVTMEHVRQGCQLSDELLAAGWPEDDLDHFRAFRMHIKEGRVTCFGDLHDYMDANMIGDTVEVWDGVKALFEDEEGEDAAESSAIVFNGAQDEVNRWIQSGGMLI